MRKLIFLVSTLTLSTSAYSIGGIGDIVSDPTSYTYYVEQINTATDSLENARQQLQKITEAKDIALNTQRNLEGSFRRAQRALSNFQSMQEQLEDDPAGFAEDWIEDRDSVQDSIRKTSRNVGRVFDPVENSIEDIQEFAGQDANDKNWSSDWVSVKAAQKSILREDLQRSVVQSEIATALTQDQLEALEELATQANTASTQKDATDVSNALLLKMIDQNQQLIELVASINKNIAMTSLVNDNQTGEDIFQKRKNIIEQENLKEPSASSSWQEKMIHRLQSEGL